MVKVHPTAIVSSEAVLEEGVEIGAFSVIEGPVRIGSGTKVGNRVTIKGRTTIGKNCKIYDGAVIGEEPQHLAYKGEETETIVGDNTIIREYVTIHRGTALDKGKTIVGEGCMLMAYSHVAHDCVVGKGVIMANCATLGGHVEVGDYAFIGGLSAVHQKTRVGAYAMVGGLSGVNLDVPPFTKASGQHAKLYGINATGLKRRGFSADRIANIKKAYRILFRSGMLIKEALEVLKRDFPQDEDIKMLVKFIETSERGVAPEGKRVSR